MLSLAVSENGVVFTLMDGQITKEGISLLVWVQSSTSFFEVGGFKGIAESTSSVYVHLYPQEVYNTFLFGNLPMVITKEFNYRLGLLP